MNNRRSITLLLLAIAALAAANFYVARNGRATPQKARTTLLDPAALSPDSLTISRPGAGEIRLARDQGWKLVSPFRGGADESVVKKLLDALGSAAVTESFGDADIDRIGSDLSRFELSVPRLRVGLSSADGSVSFSFGRTVPTGDGVYVSVDGERQIYIVSTNVLGAVNLKANDFRLREVVDFSPSDVVSLDLKRGTGSLMRFVRGEDGWRMTLPREARAGTERLKKLLEAISSASVRDWTWPVGGTNESQIASRSLLAGYGLDPDSALSVTIKNVKGEDIRLCLGDPSGENAVFALLPGSSAIVTVDAGLKDLAIGESAYFTDLRLFPIDRKLVETVSIVDGSVSCLLKIGPSGSWSMESPVAAPVDEAAANEMLTRMLAMGPSDVDTNGVVVTVSTNLPSATVSRAALFGEGGLEGLRSRRIIKVDPAVVKRLVVTDAGADPVAVAYNRDTKKWSLERTAAEKDSAAAEKPETAEPDGESLDAIVAAMNPLAAVSVARIKPASARLGEYGLDRPFRTIAVDSVGENTARRTILLGGETADGGRYATVGAADAVFVLSAETVASLTRPIVRK